MTRNRFNLPGKVNTWSNPNIDIHLFQIVEFITTIIENKINNKVGDKFYTLGNKDQTTLIFYPTNEANIYHLTIRENTGTLTGEWKLTFDEIIEGFWCNLLSLGFPQPTGYRKLRGVKDDERIYLLDSETMTCIHVCGEDIPRMGFCSRVYTLEKTGFVRYEFTQTLNF